MPVGTLKVGDSLSPAQAPQVAGKPFTIACEVEARPTDCVIVSHGGSVVGYTLYLRENRVVFALRHGDKVTRVTSAQLPAGRVTVEAALTADAELTLTVNGESATPVKAPGLLTKQPAEDFNLGFDAKNTVDEYDGTKQFEGKVEKLAITVAK